jgi:exodeoxyribonuclease VII small subunit
MAARKVRKQSDQDQDPSFEASMARLTEIVSELEEGDLSLEDSLKSFEEGVRLARASQAKLDDAEARVEKLLGLSDNGDPITEEIEVS